MFKLSRHSTGIPTSRPRAWRVGQHDLEPARPSTRGEPRGVRRRVLARPRRRERREEVAVQCEGLGEPRAVQRRARDVDVRDAEVVRLDDEHGDEMAYCVVAATG